MVCAPPPAGVFFFFNDTATTEISALSLPAALPILLALKLPPPGGTLLALQLTVPLGALAEVGVLSVTVAVQLVGLPTGTVSGAQLTTVLVACLFAVTTKLPALIRCLVSPLCLPLMV